MSRGNGPRRSLPRKRPRADLGLGRNNALLFWAHVVWGAGFATHLTLWTLFLRELGASSGQIGLVVGGSVVIRMLLAMPAGALVDRISPKPVIVGGFATPVLATAIFLGSTEWWHALIGAIVLESCGVAVPAASAYIAAAAPEGQRTKAYTYVYTMAFAIGLTIAPVVAGFVAERAGFRTAYAIAGVMFAGGVAILMLLENKRPQNESERSEQPSVTYRQVVRLRAVWAVFGLHLLVPVLPYVGLILLPNYLNEERGLSLSRIGTLGSLGAAAGLGIALLVSHWKPLGRPFFGLGFCLSLATLGFVFFLASGLFHIILFGYMLRSALNPAWSLLAAAVAEVTPERMRGRAYGLSEFGAGAGDVSAPIIAGQLYAVNPALTLWVALLTTGPLALGAFLLHAVRERLVPASSLEADDPRFADAE
jgi:MFS family permease